MAFKIPQLQRDMMYYDAPAAPPKPQKPLKIANFDKLYNIQTDSGWECMFVMEYPDCYKFIFEKRSVGFTIKLQMNRISNTIYNPHTFVSEEMYGISVLDGAYLKRIGRLNKRAVSDRIVFLSEIEKVCEQYKAAIDKEKYDALPWYDKLMKKVFNSK